MRSATPRRLGRAERRARLITLGAGLALVLALVILTLAWPRWTGNAIELVARQPSSGGWSRDRIVVRQGERVRLQIRSDDVVHGFAIGRLGVEAGPIEPGKVTTVDFVADRPGEFTFYCTLWCDPNHPRMRGVLEVRPAAAGAPEHRPPADVRLEHLDAPRAAPVVLEAKPSAGRGQRLYEARCASCHGPAGTGTTGAPALTRPEILRERSPAQAFQALAPAASTVARHAEYTRGGSDQDRWDAVAYVWSLGTSAEQLELGQRLYRTNCAVCHGQGGSADGPGGRHTPKKPADFTDARRMLAGSTDLYAAKIRRGGMGTGMPYWGSIFTEGELDALVKKVWTFTMDLGSRFAPGSQ